MKRRQWCQMEIQQAVRKVEALVKEKGNRFAALEWIDIEILASSATHHRPRAFNDREQVGDRLAA